MEEKRENPLFGRKVFFLNPNYAIEKLVVGQLKIEEYEVYVIKDYRYAKNILRHYRDSICFINVDEQLQPKEWLNFINSFREDENLSTIYIGVITERLRKAEHTSFILNTNIPAGLISLTDRIAEVTETIRGILEINGAKGRRQYVRAQCSRDKAAFLFWTQNNVMYQLKMQDISSVGTAAILPPKYYNILQQNAVITGLNITLGSKTIQLNAVVFAIKDNPSAQNKTLVLLFMKGNSFYNKNIIREYVFRTLDGEVLSSAAGEPFDSTDYSIDPPEAEKREAFLLNLTQDEIEEEERRIKNGSPEQETSGSQSQSENQQEQKKFFSASDNIPEQKDSPSEKKFFSASDEIPEQK